MEKKTAIEWSEEEGILIVDPDGWRDGGPVGLDTPISKDEYLRRKAVSTIASLRPNTTPGF